MTCVAAKKMEAEKKVDRKTGLPDLATSELITPRLPQLLVKLGQKLAKFKAFHTRFSDADVDLTAAQTLLPG